MSKASEAAAEHAYDLMRQAMTNMAILPCRYDDAIKVLENMRMLLDRHMAPLRAPIQPSEAAAVVILRSVTAPRP